VNHPPEPVAKLWFVGAGPGAADLLTVRAVRAIEAADVVIWAASLVHEDVLQHARPNAQIIDAAAARGRATAVRACRP